MTGPRCSLAALARGDDQAGTASTVRAFLLLEHDGPWGADALRDARLPDGLGPALARRARAAGVRVLLARRGRRRAAGSPSTVLAARVAVDRPVLEATTVRDLRDVLDLDLGRLRREGTLGLAVHDGPVVGVCTHGRHDACCAERGRPVAAALRETHPDLVWEVSHIGGDRFAGNLLMLPHGLYYGRVEAGEAAGLVDRHVAGRLDLDRLRGRSCWPMAVQYAEIALRRELDEEAVDAVRLVAVRRDAGTATTLARLAVADAGYDVVVATESVGRARLTCRATGEDPIPRHRVVSLTRT